MEILILIVLLVGAIVGFNQGAFKQIANFAGTLIGLLVAATCYDSVGNTLASVLGLSVGVSYTTAFVLLAIFVPVVLGIVASFLTGVVKAIKLGFLNRLAGAAIGALCYVLILSLAFNVYDFGVSKGGFEKESLEERPALYYATKHVSQVLIPNVLIVTDATEEANGTEPMNGLKDAMSSAAL